MYAGGGARWSGRSCSIVGDSQERDVYNPTSPTPRLSGRKPHPTVSLRLVVAVVSSYAMSVKAVAMPNDGAEGASRKGILLRGSVIGHPSANSRTR